MTLDASVPTVDEVARIAAIPDTVLRNFEITWCYWRLSAAMAARIGERCNWCTFGTWASRQAGATIRGEDLIDRFERRLEHGAELLHPIRSLWRSLLRRGLFRPDTRLGAIVRAVHTPFDAFERTSAAVARGNLKVFEDIVREFARYLSEVPPGERPDGPAFLRFLDGFTPGDPPDGQAYLKRAFTRYQQQLSESSDALRAELVALANLEIGLHEQTRLQPDIRESLDAPLTTKRDLRSRLLNALLPARGIWRTVIGRGPLASLIVQAAVPLARFADRVAREVITERLMVLVLPGGTALSLGQPIVTPIPEPFRSPASADLRQFLQRFESCSPARPDTGADDWSELSQRMHYILHLFCVHHDDKELFRPPFTGEQVAQFRSGRIPGRQRASGDPAALSRNDAH